MCTSLPSVMPARWLRRLSLTAFLAVTGALTNLDSTTTGVSPRAVQQT